MLLKKFPSYKAYRNKLEKLTDDTFGSISKSIHKKYGVGGQLDEPATFEEFLKYIVDKERFSAIK